MAALPPVLILLDISALLAGTTRDWQLFSRVGACYVPRAVLEEMEFLCNRASEPEVGRVAREFSQFYPTSGWQSTLSIATHPSLRPAPGQNLSSKARLSLSVAQTAYGLSRNRSEALVVLVANDQSLIQRLRIIDAPNLCGLPMAALLQWSRTLRRPLVVTNHLQMMRAPVGVVGGMTTVSPSMRSTTVQRSAPVPSKRTVTRRPQQAHHSLRLTQTFYNLLTLLLVALLGLGIWRVVQPASFNEFWKQLPIPGKSTPTRV